MLTCAAHHDPLESSVAELEALEHISWAPREKQQKKPRKRVAAANDQPRDERGRFTKIAKKGKAA